MVDQNKIDAELARRYRWFCEIGWREPTLNHPLVIHNRATSADIDRLIVCGMKKYARSTISSLPSPFQPDDAA